MMDDVLNFCQQPADARHCPLPWVARPVPGSGKILLARMHRVFPFGGVYAHGIGAAITPEALATGLFVVGACNAFYVLEAALRRVESECVDSGSGSASAMLSPGASAALRDARIAADAAMPAAIADTMREYGSLLSERSATPA